MKLARTAAELREAVGAAEGRRGFVPTMGALHAGHLSLVERARRECDQVVASVFVNPTQFDDPADLRAYPRDDAADIDLARQAGVDVLFLPAPVEVFRPGHATRVTVAGPALGFEGERRPGHFDGVALVCLKLFELTRPQVAYFGQKDAQQVAVVRQMVADLDLGLEIRVGPTVRAADGLALSSRNVRLSAEDRQRAGAIPRGLVAGLEAHRRGQDPGSAARAVLRAAGLEIDYVDVAPFPEGPTLVVAVRLGPIRLIDNVPLDRPELSGLVEPAVSGRGATP